MPTEMTRWMGLWVLLRVRQVKDVWPSLLVSPSPPSKDGV